MKDFVKNSRFSSDRVCRGEGEEEAGGGGGRGRGVRGGTRAKMWRRCANGDAWGGKKGGLEFDGGFVFFLLSESPATLPQHLGVPKSNAAFVKPYAPRAIIANKICFFFPSVLVSNCSASNYYELSLGAG